MSLLVNFVKYRLQLVCHAPVMANQTKGSVLRLYLKDDELAALKALTEAVEIPQTEVMSRIMTAGIRALKEAGNRMPLPLRFTVGEDRAVPFRQIDHPESRHKGPIRK